MATTVSMAVKPTTRAAAVDATAVPPLFKADADAKRGVAACNAAGQATFRLLLELLVAEVTTPSAAGLADAVSRVAAAFPSREAFVAAHALAARCLRLCARATREASELAGAVAAVGLSDALARDLAAAAHARRGVLQAAYGSDVPAHPHLAGVRWRTDVVLATSSLAKVMRTSTTLEFELDSGRVVTAEVPLERLHELRHGVAKALLELGAVESHPVLRLH